MWTNAQMNQATNPEKRSFQISATAWPRPMTASWPLSKYLNGVRGFPCRSPAMARAT